MLLIYKIYEKFKYYFITYIILFFLGQWLIEKTRPDIVKKFAPILKDDTAVISQYLHQCNAQTPS